MSNSVSQSYLSGLQYQGNAGSLSSMSFGNGTTQTFGLNDRFQMISQELKKGTKTLQKYNYGYGQIDVSGNLDTTKNNGQLGRVESYIGTAKQWPLKLEAIRCCILHFINLCLQCGRQRRVYL